MARRRDPPRAGVLEGDVAGILAAQLRELGSDVREHEGVDFVALHVGDRADGELADDFGGDDGFGAGGGEGAFDAVDAEGRVAPPRHEGSFFGLVDRGRAAEGFVEVGHGVAYVAVERFLVLGERGHHVGDAGDQDRAVRVDEAAEHAHEVRHGFLRRAAEDAAVEILSGAADGEGVVVAASEAVGQAWFLGAEPVVVADADGVCFLEEAARFGFRFDEVVETLAAVFLHAFKAHEQIHRELDPRFLVSLDGVEPT